jgi:hypothetical protein
MSNSRRPGEDHTPGCPEWLAEIMAEIGARHDLRTPDGCREAQTAAERFSDDYGLKCRACAALARGYHHTRLALLHERQDPGGEGYAAAHEHAGRSFAEAIGLGRQADEVGA